MMLAEKVTWTQMMERTKHKREVADLQAAVERTLRWGSQWKLRCEGKELLLAFLLYALVASVGANVVFLLILLGR